MVEGKIILENKDAVKINISLVKIEDFDGASETHEDWVMFSELNQPDVIPITNY